MALLENRRDGAEADEDGGRRDGRDGIATYMTIRYRLCFLKGYYIQ